MSINNCKGCKYEFSAFVQSPCLKCDRFPKEELKDYYESKNEEVKEINMPIRISHARSF